MYSDDEIVGMKDNSILLSITANNDNVEHQIKSNPRKPTVPLVVVVVVWDAFSISIRSIVARILLGGDGENERVGWGGGYIPEENSVGCWLCFC